jgi:hypothetical protein
VTRTIKTVVAASFVLAATACGSGEETIPAPAVGGRGEKIEPTFKDFELPGPNLYFFCDGSYGVYMSEGSNNDSGKSAAPFVVNDHHSCGGET